MLVGKNIHIPSLEAYQALEAMANNNPTAIPKDTLKVFCSAVNIVSSIEIFTYPMPTRDLLCSPGFTIKSTFYQYGVPILLQTCLMNLRAILIKRGNFALHQLLRKYPEQFNKVNLEEYTASPTIKQVESILRKVYGWNTPSRVKAREYIVSALLQVGAVTF
jgi:hypothetical protein